MNCTRTRARRQWKFLPPNIAIFAPNTQGMRACEAHFVPNTQGASRTELRGKKRQEPLPSNKMPERTTSRIRGNGDVAAAQQRCSPPIVRTPKQKPCSNPRRRPSWLLTAYMPELRFRRSRSFPYRPSARPRLPSFAPSRLHSPCRHTSYGRRRWSPCRARSRYRPRTAR